MPKLSKKERQNLLDDLKGVISGEVFTSEIFSQLYSTDASLYEIQPAAIVRPTSVEDVVACVNYAAEHQLSVTPRGAGTGLAGESLNNGIILDFSHSMRKILSTKDGCVAVQPGVVLGNLNRHLKKEGRLFGPDPSTRNVTTIGGVISIDSSGSHYLKYGSARHKVLGLQVVLADGEIIETSETHFHSVDYNRFRKSEIVAQLQTLLTRNEKLIADHEIKGVNNRSGYNLWEMQNDSGRIDLNRLLTGSEGTLGIVTGATVATDPLPISRGVVLFFFERLERATEAINMIRQHSPSACDLLDRRLLNITKETEKDLDGTIPPLAENMILVEFDGETEEEVLAKIDGLVRKVQRQHGLAFHSSAATDPRERNRFWRIVRRVVMRLSKVTGWYESVPFVEDMAVPPERLHEFITESQKILRRHRITASIFAHAGHGQTHIRPFMDLGDEKKFKTDVRSISLDLSNLVLEFGGTISGEHGDGLSRSYFLQKQFGELYPVFREVKRIFDPDNLLNPGKIVGNISQRPDDFLRKQFDPIPAAEAKKKSEPNALKILEPNLPWSETEISDSVQACNGCGRCRTAQPHERMCPIFRMLPGEEASPRAKANLARGILSGQIGIESIASDEFKNVVDLCVNCHQCRKECPAEVDIPKLMLEAKSQYVTNYGLSLSQTLFSRLDFLCKVGARFSWSANFLNSSNWFRWILEKTTGLAQGRKLPRFPGGSFLAKSYWKKISKISNSSGPKVAYFVDAVPNWIDIELSEALLAVMKTNGIDVYVPPSQQYSGLSLISNGVADRAIRVARRNVEIFAEAIRAGYHVVTTEPAAALCLQNEYRSLLGNDDDTKLVAENTSEICHYLWNRHLEGRLNTNFQPINATLGYHWPCHQKTLSDEKPGMKLLQLIPELNVVSIDKGCSGMAGTFGLMRQNYRKSLRAGWDLISTLRHSDITSGTTECSACKMQMEQGTTKPTFHPLKLLAYSYGFFPDLLERMHRPNHERFISS